MDRVRTTGYVVDTLEAVFWLVFNENTYEKTVLKAVNLGGDTDTIAALAGGCAGVIYGFSSINDRWIQNVAKLAEKANFDIKYQGVAKFPAVTRDISLVMKKTVLAGQIEEVIRKSGGKLLEDYHLFDIYEGENVGKDEKSLAYSIRFRAKDRTLEDKDVSAVIDKILKKLENLGVTLRQ